MLPDLCTLHGGTFLSLTVRADPPLTVPIVTHYNIDLVYILSFRSNISNWHHLVLGSTEIVVFVFCSNAACSWVKMQHTPLKLDFYLCLWNKPYIHFYYLRTVRWYWKQRTNQLLRFFFYDANFPHRILRWILLSVDLCLCVFLIMPSMHVFFWKSTFFHCENNGKVEKKFSEWFETFRLVLTLRQSCCFFRFSMIY